jgi:hypothetical protein
MFSTRGVRHLRLTFNPARYDRLERDSPQADKHSAWLAATGPGLLTRATVLRTPTVYLRLTSSSISVNLRPSPDLMASRRYERSDFFVRSRPRRVVETSGRFIGRLLCSLWNRSWWSSSSPSPLPPAIRPTPETKLFGQRFIGECLEWLHSSLDEERSYIYIYIFVDVF